LVENEKGNSGKKKNVYYNEKYLKKKSGLYQPTTLEQAKKLLKDNKLDIADLMNQKIWGEL